jgi:hypothetical protein
VIKLAGSFVLLANLCAVIASGQTSQQTGIQNHLAVQTDESRLVTLANKWTEAINSKDREKLDELMAPDYALNTWNGKVLVPRSRWMDNLFTHITIEKNSSVDIFPRIYGDVAIVASKAEWIGVEDGRHFNKKCTVLDTWRMRNGNWKVVNRTSDCIDQ